MKTAINNFSLGDIVEVTHRRTGERDVYTSKAKVTGKSKTGKLMLSISAISLSGSGSGRFFERPEDVKLISRQTQGG